MGSIESYHNPISSPGDSGSSSTSGGAGEGPGLVIKSYTSYSGWACIDIQVKVVWNKMYLTQIEIDHSGCRSKSESQYCYIITVASWCCKLTQSVANHMWASFLLPGFNCFHYMCTVSNEDLPTLWVDKAMILLCWSWGYCCQICTAQSCTTKARVYRKCNYEIQFNLLV